jgi:hypothetical protein
MIALFMHSFPYVYVVFPCNYTVQANLDNGTAGGMSTRGFITQVILHGYFMKTSECNLFYTDGPVRWYNLGFITRSNRKLLQYLSFAWFMTIWIQ